MTQDFVGYVDLESTLVGSLLVLNSSGVPVQADASPTYRVYGPDGFLESGTVSARNSGSITGATNASPIVITSASHGLTTGAYVTITGVSGNTGANGTFQVTRIDADTFSLDGSTGTGTYTTGGTWVVTGLYKYSIDALGVTGYEQGENYQVHFTWDLSNTAQGLVHSFNVS